VQLQPVQSPQGGARALEKHACEMLLLLLMMMKTKKRASGLGRRGYGGAGQRIWRELGRA